MRLLDTDNLALKVIVISLPFILWGVCGILPTFDDYTSLQSPWWVQIADPGYFFPDSVRRPFDALLGCVVGWWPALFPTLNHVLIILGHTASTCLVFAICRRLQLGTLATNIATLFFFFSPATLGATLACDGFNQTYAHLWGLLSLWLYIRGKRLWLACVVMAVLSKENGLAWAVVPPVVSYAFNLVSRRQALRHVAMGVLVALVYFAIYYSIYKSGVLNIEYDEQYAQATMTDHLKDLIQLLAYTWLPMDYMSVVYAPLRNWPIAVLTACIALPFLLLLCSKWRLAAVRPLLLLIVSFFILTSPHLLTVVSIMHNYAPLSIAALIVGVIVSCFSGRKILIASFALFMAAALFTDTRHYIAARQSGLLGRQMALEAIHQAPKPLEHVMCINIDQASEPRYSSFCVRPVDAFAWGLSVRHYSHYQWKTRIEEVTLPAYDSRKIKALADSARQSGCEAVWVVGHDKENLTIISPLR